MSAIARLMQLTALSGNEYEGLFERDGREYKLVFEVTLLSGCLVVALRSTSSAGDAFGTHHINEAIMAMHIAHNPAPPQMLPPLDADALERAKARVVDQFSTLPEGERDHLVSISPDKAKENHD